MSLINWAIYLDHTYSIIKKKDILYERMIEIVLYEKYISRNHVT